MSCFVLFIKLIIVWSILNLFSSILSSQVEDLSLSEKFKKFKLKMKMITSKNEKTFFHIFLKEK